MSTIDLYQVLKKIPDVTDEQAKQAADATEQSARLEKIDADIADLKTDITELKTTTRIGIALLLALLAIELAPLLQ